MKKFLIVAVLLLMALTACDATIEEVSTRAEEVVNTAEEAIDTAAEEVTAPAEETTLEEEAATAEEMIEEEVNPTEEEATEEAPIEAVSATGEEVSDTVNGAEIVQSVEADAVPAATINTDGYYMLQTMFLENENKCLEGNQMAEGAVLNGAAFMNDCNGAVGENWKLVPADNGYYRLQTQFLEEQNKCLEGSKYDAAVSLDGGFAFMDDCKNVTGQYWKFVPSEVDGYYRLQTMFLEGEGKCLEGNQYPDGSVLSGAAFMDNCLNVTGQLWKLVPVGGSVENPEPADTQAVTGPVVLTFIQTDDKATVYVNDQEPFTQGIIHHNQPQGVYDITDMLQPGLNTIHIVAENGPASATLIATITANGEVIYSINEQPGYIPAGVFYDETFEINR